MPITKKEAVEMLGLEKSGSVDYALPQDWCDDFKEATKSSAHPNGVYPVNCFVWHYPYKGEGGIFGRPVPLTVEAKELLALYNKRRGTNYPIPKYPRAYVIEIKAEVSHG